MNPEPRRGRAIDQFMWSYQHFFRVSAEYSISEVFRTIKADVEARLFLVGFRLTPQAATWPICIEPERGPYHPDQLRGVAARAAELFDQDAERKIFNSDPGLHEARQRGLEDAARAQAIAEALEGVDDAYIFKVGRSTHVGDFAVYPALQLMRTQWESLARLDRECIDRVRLTQSLADGVVQEIHRLVWRALRQPDPGAGAIGVLDADATYIARQAATNLMHSVSLLGGQMFGNQLFEQLTALSTIPYEGRVGRGEIIVCKAGHSDVEVMLQLTDPAELGGLRAVRKLLEMSEAEISLLTDGEKVLGLGRLRPGTRYREDLFIIRVTGTGVWELHAGDKPLLRVDHGHATVPRSKLSRAQFDDTLRRCLTNVSDAGLAVLWRQADEATRQMRGAMIVVSVDASEEAARLKPQALAIKAMPADEALIRVATGIDGGVLLDPEGVCHAIGVILDGAADGVGDPSRGSRFNSAVRYLRSDPPGCVILVVSEDGMINVLPELRPQIMRQEISDALLEVVEAAENVSEDGERWARAWDRAKSLVFYLDGGQCAVANAAWRTVDERRAAIGDMRILEPPLKPNTDMNESCFLD